MIVSVLSGIGKTFDGLEVVHSILDVLEVKSCIVGGRGGITDISNDTENVSVNVLELTIHSVDGVHGLGCLLGYSVVVGIDRLDEDSVDQVDDSQDYRSNDIRGRMIIL